MTEVADSQDRRVVLGQCFEEEPSTTRRSKGWYSRGYLPHVDAPGLIQHITFHLADSLPCAAIDRMRQEVESLASERQSVERRKRIHALLDSGLGSCVLQDADCASIVEGSLLFGDGGRYRLLAWIVMPNHVHVLIEQHDACRWPRSFSPGSATLRGPSTAWQQTGDRRADRQVDRRVALGQTPTPSGNATTGTASFATRSIFWQRSNTSRIIRLWRGYAILPRNGGGVVPGRGGRAECNSAIHPAPRRCLLRRCYTSRSLTADSQLRSNRSPASPPRLMIDSG